MNGLNNNDSLARLMDMLKSTGSLDQLLRSLFGINGTPGQLPFGLSSLTGGSPGAGWNGSGSLGGSSSGPGGGGSGVGIGTPSNI